MTRVGIDAISIGTKKRISSALHPAMSERLPDEAVAGTWLAAVDRRWRRL
jgi:hypothetical protein